MALAILGAIAIVVFGLLGFAAASVGPDAIGPDPGLVLAVSIAGVVAGGVAVAVAVLNRPRQP